MKIKKKNYSSFFSYILLGDNMNNKYKTIGILILTGFSFFYTYKVSSFIKDNDPIMTRINNIEDTLIVSKIDPIINDDEYITGINGCIVNKEESYSKMKDNKKFNEDLIVMKEDKVLEDLRKYVVGGNKQNRKVSIILVNYNDEINNFIKNNNIDINYFIDGKTIKDDISNIINLKGKIYNYRRDNTYSNKYILYDNTIIKTNLDNNPNYCLVTKKDKDVLELCSKYNMKTIKTDEIKEDILQTVKLNLENGKIFLINSTSLEDIKYSINYILSKGYKIVYLDELLDESNPCKGNIY